MKVRWLAVAGALTFCATGAGAQTFQKEVACAAQSERVYQNDWANFATSVDMNITGYEDHYNPNMGRCFILEHTLITGSGSSEHS
jgi:O-acetyl-ADP-ribose deacetylase (regulator of RNase III)